MDAETVRWFLTGVFGLVMYLIKRTVDSNERRVEGLEKELQDVKMNYLHKNDFKEFKLELREMFSDLKKDISELKFTHGTS